MVKVNPHSEVVEACPTSGKQEVWDIECETFQTIGLESVTAALGQIAHIKVQVNTSATAIISAKKYNPILDRMVLEASFLAE